MIKSLITIFLLAATINICSAQTATQSERIVMFCKFWGFLKYKHAAVGSGNLDWDSVFIHNIDKATLAKTKTEFNELLAGILDKIGSVERREPAKVEGDMFLFNVTNNGWINKSKILSNEVKQQLNSINGSQGPGANRYIKLKYNTADFSGENKYDTIGFPGKEHRLLFLSRFWNIINYFAPYKYLATNWDQVLETFVPKVIQSIDSISYYKTLLQLCRSLRDGHSQLSLKDSTPTDHIFGSYTMPFYCEIIEGKVVVRGIGKSPDKTSDIQQGDIVLSVNDTSVNQLINDRRNYVSSSNKAGEDHQLSGFVLDGKTAIAKLEIKRDNKVFKTTVTRVSTSQRDWGAFINYSANDVGYKMMEDSILLVYAMQIWKGNIDTIKHLIKQARAVIFDVRNYPQNDEFFFISDPFLTEPKQINSSTVARPDFPGLFKWEPNANKIGRINENPFKGKVIIIADERTQSQGEYSCMVLQTIPGCITIGSQTAGADGVVTYIPMGGGVRMSYSGYGVYYPDKTQTQVVGIKIDITVKKTIGAIKNNRDEILERALQYLKRK